jgi:hypothetical protein
MAWVGRLRARASNCRLPIVFSVSPGVIIASWVVSISCVAYLRKGIRLYSCLFPPNALRGFGADARHATCSLHALTCCGAVEAHGAVARSLGCGMSCMGAGSWPLLSQAMHLSLDTNDCRGRLDPVVAYVLDRTHVAVGIVEECYLVDPASSHMLVSKIKPCMCKYELIQTVKLRMAH